ncbi:MAG: hypothetical protein AB7L91_12775 [Dehalococcoidia bacterium]
MEPPVAAGAIATTVVQRDSKPVPQARPRSRPRPEIGILTAIPREFHAVRAMFDNVAPSQSVPSYHPSRHAVNLYEHGSIGGRSVVMAYSGQGNSASAVSATAMLDDFDSITLLVMLGIAGGVPAPNDPEHHVRLGDVVISTEAVVEYDFRKLEVDNEWQRKWREKPPAHLIDQIVNRIEHQVMNGEEPWEPLLTEVLSHIRAERPVLDELHDDRQVVDHPTDPSRKDGVPRLHRGRIGSASILLKHPKIRDMLRDTYRIQAIEMEGAGVAEAAYRTNTPYVVIRGIADYCDMHKNDAWHGYAAAVATAFCRILLDCYFETLPKL